MSNTSPSPDSSSPIVTKALYLEDLICTHVDSCHALDDIMGSVFEFAAACVREGALTTKLREDLASAELDAATFRNILSTPARSFH